MGFLQNTCITDEGQCGESCFENNGKKTCQHRMLQLCKLTEPEQHGLQLPSQNGLSGHQGALEYAFQGQQKEDLSFPSLGWLAFFPHFLIIKVSPNQERRNERIDRDMLGAHVKNITPHENISPLPFPTFLFSYLWGLTMIPLLIKGVALSQRTYDQVSIETIFLLL